MKLKQDKLYYEYGSSPKKLVKKSLITGDLRRKTQFTPMVKFDNVLSVMPMQVSLRLRLDRHNVVSGYR